MTTTLATTEALANHPSNPVDRILAAEFSDDSLWKDRREILAGVPDYSGFKRPTIGGYPDTSRFVADEPPQSWLAAAYGARIVDDPEHLEDNGVRIEVADLETMVKIHERLSETVLVGEHAHTSILVEPPKPLGGTKAAENNTLWLEMIADSHWPVMTTGRVDEQGRPEYFSHDYADYHTANMLLMPRELQDLMSAGAQNEKVWRNGFLAGKNVRIRGDNGREDPFASGFRGDSGHSDGITKIDNLSDSHSYLPLLSYMIRGESGEAQLATLTAYIEAEQAGGEHDEQLHGLAVDVLRLERVVGDLLNFNTLHATGRTTTNEAIKEAMQAVLRGTARVADKLQGRPAADVDSTAPLSPEPIAPEPAATSTTETVIDDWDEPYDRPQPEAAPTPAPKTRFLGNLAARASKLVRRGQ